MKGKRNLEKAIVLGLLLSTSVYGSAWAKEIPEVWSPEVVDDKLIIHNVTETIRNSDDYTFNGKKISDYSQVEIFFEAKEDEKRPIGVYSERFDWENTDLILHVNGNYSNNDALHFSNFDPYINLKSLTIDMQAKGSDAINLSRDIAGNADVHLTCDIYAVVKDGNGIRANASINYNPEVYTSKITIDGNTYIELDSDAHNRLEATTGASVNPTAVWAGSDANYLTASQKAYGKGEIYLNGDTVIQLNGAGKKSGGFLDNILMAGKVYGISAGKNGYIEVNNLQITAEKEYTYAISASDVNLSYNGVDNTENKQGTKVILNGDWNKILMKGGNSKAIYAKGVDANGDANTVKSGENGIGNLDSVGDIVAENGGKIDLDIRDWADIKGNIEAIDNAVIDLGIIKNTSEINLMSQTQGAMNIRGNVQAANDSTINLTLGDGAYFAGRVDDYKDADSDSWSSDTHELFDKDFASNVESSGKVNLNLGNNSTWFVTEQSWATSVNTKNSIINLTRGENSNYAVHIGELTGNTTFIVNLDPDTENTVNNGNMIYVYNGTGAKDLNLYISNEADILNGLKDGEKLRFATVATAGHGFGDTYVAKGRGVINSGFSIEYENYDSTNTEENSKYNGNEFAANKPGNEYIDNIYNNGENVYLVRDSSKDEGLSDSGETIINMSRANYKNAIYMDRLNKRLGEARYINGEEEQGMWVRLRHDRIGQSGDFRSMNTMYELGYDVKQDCDNGDRRVGFAVDYMRGSTTYSDIMGKGEIKRYGLWLYDTWLGDKGHYADYVLKWGHLSNDFDIHDKDSFEHITGDYSNNVFSVSAEYGKKNDMGSGWYFEPQAQLQLARVTGADYVSSQDTKVSVDGINSLIGRAGFRLGRDLNESSTVYLKADLLHEFLGDQTITAQDATGTLREEFENKGTWYDVGLGFAAQTGKNSYAFLDVEKSFGNDNDETYQINAGLQWTF